ncbi:xylan 1,4-beta-xylosidase, partial [Streptomyces sp. UH6]|nr:xylan 1,4-beta-xylosidase [Streptomyces sp. UH6]
RPLAPGDRQLDALREAAEPARSHRSVPVTGGRADVDLVLGRNEVTLLELTPVVDETPEWWSDDRLFGLGARDTP